MVTHQPLQLLNATEEFWVRTAKSRNQRQIPSRAPQRTLSATAPWPLEPLGGHWAQPQVQVSPEDRDIVEEAAARVLLAASQET